MALLDFGVGDIAQAASKIISLFVEDPTEKGKALARIGEMGHEEIMAALDLDKQAMKGQTDTNIEEAKSSNLFVAGWRPFVGWTCGSAFALNMVVLPLMNFAIVAFGGAEVRIALDTATIISTLFGMLGIGGMRTYEKVKGVAR